MTNRPVRVHLFGSENNGWALDTDLALTKRSLESIQDVVELTTFEEADVIHSVWEEPLFELDQSKLQGKRVVCHVCNDFMRLHENPSMIRATDTIGLWVVMSWEAERDLQTLGYDSFCIPYSVDTEVFKPLGDKKTQAALRTQYGLPETGFIISNFMRDSFGHDLDSPKDQKGTELLLEIGCQLLAEKVPVHYLLTGPRRHWIRKRLEQSEIPFTFIGKEIEEDDLNHNIQSAKVVADLYSISDVHLITSRWEGGPRSVLEAAATKTPILCTPVGTAPDILNKSCIYGAVDEAIDKIRLQYEARYLDGYLEEQQSTILKKHTPESNADRFRQLYLEVDRVRPYNKVTRWVEKPVKTPSIAKRVTNITRTLFGKSVSKKQLCISLWHKFHKPPYGGGNQFMMALQVALERQGINVVTNKLSEHVDAHICNSCWFDYKKFEKKASDFPIRMIHRIDGPVTLYRGEGRQEDENIFHLNKRFASATVFQSAYSFKKSYELGFSAISPIIIHNSVNDTIFNSLEKPPFSPRKKIRLITSAWSDNPRKGGAFLKWLDSALDWNRFEYTFVGRVKESFDNINHIDAVPSDRLADLLRQHDVYVSVSLHEPCSNALLEALFCGLPALYRDDGGNPELVSFGGLPFTDEEDVLEKLDRLVNCYDSFQRLIYLRSIDDIAKRYIKLAKRICDWQA